MGNGARARNAPPPGARSAIFRLSVWLTFRPYVAIVGCILVLEAAIAIYLIVSERQKLARVALALAMVPTGLIMIEGTAAMAPYFSLADAARFLNQAPHKKGDVFYEGPLHLGSSLVFYLNRPFFLVNQSAEAELAPSGRQSWRDRFLSEPFLLTRWRDPETVYLLVEVDRLPHWQGLLTDRFHILPSSREMRHLRGVEQSIVNPSVFI